MNTDWIPENGREAGFGKFNTLNSSYFFPALHYSIIPNSG
jgi:hypothetical protein